jgi:hypothetical protein
VRQRWDEQESGVRSQKPEEKPQAPAKRNGGPSGSAALRKQKAVGSGEKEAGNSEFRIHYSELPFYRSDKALHVTSDF